jgi:acetoacetate decarboxylase
MDISKITQNAFSMPLSNPSYPKGPYRFINREYLIITYRTDPKLLEAVVPKPLSIKDPIVMYEFIKMPDSSGFGDYTESGQVIPVYFEGKKGNYVHSMFLDCQPPIAAGREIWGFPKTFAQPSLEVMHDTLIGNLHYYDTKIAEATMTYKYKRLDPKMVQKDLEETPNYLLKIIPHVDGSTQVCELTSYHLQDVTVKEAWSGHATLELHPHVMANCAALPVLEIISCVHFISDLTLPYGKVIHDYLK